MIYPARLVILPRAEAGSWTICRRLSKNGTVITIIRFAARVLCHGRLPSAVLPTQNILPADRAAGRMPLYMLHPQKVPLDGQFVQHLDERFIDRFALAGCALEGHIDHLVVLDADHDIALSLH